MNKKIAMTLILMASFVAVNAQLKDMMMKKVGDKVKSKSEKNTTTTETNTNTNDAPVDTTAKTNSTPTNQPGGYNPFMSGGKKEILPQYVFQQNVLMDMKSYDKKGNLEEKKSSKMRWHFSTEPYNAIEQMDEKNKGAFSIFEVKKSQMVTLMDNDGSKVAMVSKIDTTKAKEKNAENSAKSGPVTKTGRTKKVCGYTCEEWVSTDEKGNKSEMWMSAEVPITMGGSFAMFGEQDKNMKSKMGSGNYPAGYMMEFTSYDVNGEKFTMMAIEVNLNAPKTISTQGYMVY